MAFGSLMDAIDMVCCCPVDRLTQGRQNVTTRQPFRTRRDVLGLHRRCRAQRRIRTDKESPNAKFDRVGPRFDVNPPRTLYGFDSLGLGRIDPHACGRELVIVQRDGCLEPRMCHAVIIGKTGYGKVNVAMWLGRP
jgi:hypothetical protein